VYRAASLLQVAHARNVLITAGIHCELRNQYLAGALGDLPMMETWPQLYVDDADEGFALSALARASNRWSLNSRNAGVVASNSRAPPHPESRDHRTGTLGFCKMPPGSGLHLMCQARISALHPHAV
jgi:hypothetical protein